MSNLKNKLDFKSTTGFNNIFSTLEIYSKKTNEPVITFAVTDEKMVRIYYGLKKYIELTPAEFDEFMGIITKDKKEVFDIVDAFASQEKSS